MRLLGRVFTFGRGDSGQLGHGATQSIYEANAVQSIANAQSVSAGGAFSLAVVGKSHDLFGWGYGEMGQLANGSCDSNAPEQFELKGRFVISAAAGGQHTLFLLKPKSES